MIFVGILFTVISITVAQSEQEQEVDPINVIVVPPNCSAGQQLVNGVCRDIWSWRSNPNAADLGVIDKLAWERNVVTVPPNCPPGQELVNGVCRDIWRARAVNPSFNDDTYSDSEQRNRRQTDSENSEVDEFDITYLSNRNIINIPPQCPIGYKPDALGVCRKIF